MKAKNNPRPTIDDLCEVCGKPYAELHEVFFAANRQKSIEHGMQIRLCAEHHRGPNGPHCNKDRDTQLKEQYQQIFECLHGHEMFMREFGRNYLDL